MISDCVHRTSFRPAGPAAGRANRGDRAASRLVDDGAGGVACNADFAGCSASARSVPLTLAASAAATTNMQGFDEEDGGVGAWPASPINQRAKSLAAAPKQAAQREADGLRRAPQAHARAFARRLAVGRLGAAGQAHHRADGGDREGAVGHAQQRTRSARSGQFGASEAGCHQAQQGHARGQAAAAPSTCLQRAHASCQPTAAAGECRQQHARQRAAMLHARELRGRARREARTPRRQRARG